MHDIFYTSPEHKRRFLTVMLTIDKIDAGKLDPEYAEAVYVLTANAGIWQRVSGYVSRRGIEFETLLAEVDLSGGYTVLVKWAANLFNELAAHIDPVELMRLDESNFNVALTALQIRRVNLPLSELATKAELYNIEMDIRNRATAENRDKPWLPLQPGE